MLQWNRVGQPILGNMGHLRRQQRDQLVGPLQVVVPIERLVHLGLDRLLVLQVPASRVERVHLAAQVVVKHLLMAAGPRVPARSQRARESQQSAEEALPVQLPCVSRSAHRAVLSAWGLANRDAIVPTMLHFSGVRSRRSQPLAPFALGSPRGQQAAKSSPP
jgi:hypothetical protein